MRNPFSRAPEREDEQSSQPEAPPFYLVSAAGQPNFGDEFITRAWLDWLAAHHPHTDVWLDCFEPGRAAHLFRDAHPRLRTTNTLWQLAHAEGPAGIQGSTERIDRIVLGLGSPKVDFGLRQLREVHSIHLLGGGYMNTIWQWNLGILAAMTSFKRHFGVPLYATGQGLLPHEHDSRQWMKAQLAELDYVEARDRESAEAFDVTYGTDDAFLAFANDRKIYADAEGLPSSMVLIQGDFVEPERNAELEGLIGEFAGAVAEDGRLGFAEGIPPEDARFTREYVDGGAEYFTFMRIWDDGFPAYAGQEWLTSRFHFHLLAAAAGARGALVNVRSGYYDIKHELLIERGTGWSMQGDHTDDVGVQPTGSPDFPEIARELGARKAAIAAELYPPA